jgi:prepilin-type N-terminal cleavage/methylation domain-containing protein
VKTPFRHGGMTLVEVLVVIAIVAIVSAFLFAAFFAAKDRAKFATDFSNLRQIGIAGTLYASDNDDAFPLSVRPLILDGRLSAQICRSPSDVHQEGLLSAFINQMAPIRAKIPDPIPNCTYIGPADALWTWNMYQRRIMPGRNPGWLVNLVRARAFQGSTHIAGRLGPYQRLMLDSSVQTRRMGFHSLLIDGALETKVIAFGSYFNDEDALWFEQHR